MTHAFVTSIIPQIEPTEEQVQKCLKILGMSPDKITCAYCGDQTTEWDHLRPLVKNKMPTGYVSEIQNLVPACGKCNQSKGNKDWKVWMVSEAKLSPKSRNIEGLVEKIEKLEEYEKWGNTKPVDFSKFVEPSLWNQHWENREQLFEVMEKGQVVAMKIKEAIQSEWVSG